MKIKVSVTAGEPYKIEEITGSTTYVCVVGPGNINWCLLPGEAREAVECLNAAYKAGRKSTEAA